MREIAFEHLRKKTLISQKNILKLLESLSNPHIFIWSIWSNYPLILSYWLELVTSISSRSSSLNQGGQLSLLLQSRRLIELTPSINEKIWVDLHDLSTPDELTHGYSTYFQLKYSYEGASINILSIFGNSQLTGVI